MKNNRIEYIVGGAAVATLAGVALATYLYKNANRVYSRSFDKKKVEKVEGRIEEITYSGRENGEDRGVVIMLNMEEDLIPVHMGPAWYVDHQVKKLNPGDTIQVKGSRINYNHETVLIAETITKGGRMIRLRDAEGHPKWSAWAKV